MKEAVVFDIDGTLVDSTGLEDWMTGVRTDYDEFHRLVVQAPPILPVLDRAHYYWSYGHEVLLVTARSDRHRGTTAEWLARHDVPYHLLAMRADDDLRRDVETKSEMIIDLMEEYAILHAYEDNPDMVAWLLSQGIKTTKVGDRV